MTNLTKSRFATPTTVPFPELPNEILSIRLVFRLNFWVWAPLKLKDNWVVRRSNSTKNELSCAQIFRIFPFFAYFFCNNKKGSVSTMVIFDFLKKGRRVNHKKMGKSGKTKGILSGRLSWVAFIFVNVVCRSNSIFFELSATQKFESVWFH